MKFKCPSCQTIHNSQLEYNKLPCSLKINDEYFNEEQNFTISRNVQCQCGKAIGKYIQTSAKQDIINLWKLNKQLAIQKDETQNFFLKSQKQFSKIFLQKITLLLQAISQQQKKILFFQNKILEMKNPKK